MTPPTALRMLRQVTISLAVLMLATSLYCAVHLVASWIRLRHNEPDVDLVHVAMGSAMAAMLVVSVNQRANLGLGLTFAAFASWFAVRGLRRHLQHALVCAAMVYMLTGFSAPAAQASGGSMSTMSHGAAGTQDAVAGAGQISMVALVLAVVLLSYAGWNVAELVLAGHGSVSRDAQSIPAPRLAIGCQLIMAVAMGYLLLTS